MKLPYDLLNVILDVKHKFISPGNEERLVLGSCGMNSDIELRLCGRVFNHCHLLKTYIVCRMGSVKSLSVRNPWTMHKSLQ